MKISPTGFFVLSLLWIAVSLLWFLWIRSPIIGFIWLGAGTAGLIIAIISRNRKQQK